MTASDVKEIVEGMHVVDGAGVHLNRLIASRRLDQVDPFVLLDEFKSDDPDDYIAGFPMHPHRGIETITYMIEGSFRHKDSRGGGGVLTSGDVQWMTAGKGIQHEEMPGMTEGKLWGFQLWLNLAAKDKWAPPRYQHLDAGNMPVAEDEGLAVKLIAGEYGGLKGPADTWYPISYFDVRISEGARFSYPVPATMNRFLYVHTGSVVIDPDGKASTATSGHVVILDEAPQVEIGAGEGGGGFLFISGEPHNEPVARGGPFVMNTQEEIRQAFEDYRSGRLF